MTQRAYTLDEGRWYQFIATGDDGDAATFILRRLAFAVHGKASVTARCVPASIRELILSLTDRDHDFEEDARGYFGSRAFAERVIRASRGACGERARGQRFVDTIARNLFFQALRHVGIAEDVALEYSVTTTLRNADLAFWKRTNIPPQLGVIGNDVWCANRAVEQGTTTNAVLHVIHAIEYARLVCGPKAHDKMWSTIVSAIEASLDP